MKIFGGYIQASRIGQTRTAPVSGMANNEDEMHGAWIKLALEYYPQSEGFGNHSAGVALIRDGAYMADERYPRTS